MPEDDTFGDEDFGFDDDVAPLAPSPSDMVDSMALAMGLDPNELARPTQNQIANTTPVSAQYIHNIMGHLLGRVQDLEQRLPPRPPSVEPGPYENMPVNEAELERHIEDRNYTGDQARAFRVQVREWWIAERDRRVAHLAEIGLDPERPTDLQVRGNFSVVSTIPVQTPLLRWITPDVQVPRHEAQLREAALELEQLGFTAEQVGRFRAAVREEWARDVSGILRLRDFRVWQIISTERLVRLEEEARQTMAQIRAIGGIEPTEDRVRMTRSARWEDPDPIGIDPAATERTAIDQLLEDDTDE